jgi:hypothetical protein
MPSPPIDPSLLWISVPNSQPVMSGRGGGGGGDLIPAPPWRQLQWLDDNRVHLSCSLMPSSLTPSRPPRPKRRIVSLCSRARSPSQMDMVTLQPQYPWINQGGSVQNQSIFPISYCLVILRFWNSPWLAMIFFLKSSLSNFSIWLGSLQHASMI